VKNYRWDRNLWCEVANIQIQLREENSIVMWARPTLACWNMYNVHVCPTNRKCLFQSSNTSCKLAKSKVQKSKLSCVVCKRELLWLCLIEMRRNNYESLRILKQNDRPRILNLSTKALTKAKRCARTSDWMIYNSINLLIWWLTNLPRPATAEVGRKQLGLI